MRTVLFIFIDEHLDVVTSQGNLWSILHSQVDSVSEWLNIMLIGELAQRTGLTRDTIRFYEKMGLINASDRPAGTRAYKEFSENMMERLLLIHQAKALGFTLNEIKQLLLAWGDHSNIPKPEQIRIVERKIEEISQKRHQLAEIESDLTAKLNQLKHEISR